MPLKLRNAVLSLLHQEIEANPNANEPDSNPPETDTELPSEKIDSDKMTVIEIDGYGYIDTSASRRWG